jgi:hypothetical protein
MKRLVLKFMLVVLLIGLVGYTRSSEAAIIGNWETNRMVSGIGLEITSQPFEFCFGCVFGPEAYLFEDINLDSSYIGQTLTATQFTDPDFDTVVSVLTNGNNDFIEYCFGGCDGLKEALFFYGDSTGASGIDFNGYTINSISVTINELSLNYDGQITDMIFQGTVTIDGQSIVPEPISSILFVVGGTLLAGRRYIRRKT